MDNEIMKIEQRIKFLANSEFGRKYNIVLSLSQLEDIPINDFRELQALMMSGKAILRQYPLSTGSGTFSIISTNFEKWLFRFYSILTIIIPITGLVLSIIYSWWFLLLFLFHIFFLIPFGKRIYLHALFNRAVISEIAFCFLFCGNCITIELPGHGIISYKPHTKSQW
jgi:hypothetical protein